MFEGQPDQIRILAIEADNDDFDHKEEYSILMEKGFIAGQREKHFRKKGDFKSAMFWKSVYTAIAALLAFMIVNG